MKQIVRGGAYGATHRFQIVGSISEAARAYLNENHQSWRCLDANTSFMILSHNGQLGDLQINEDGDIAVQSTGIVLKIVNGQAMTLEEK